MSFLLNLARSHSDCWIEYFVGCSGFEWPLERCCRLKFLGCHLLLRKFLDHREQRSYLRCWGRADFFCAWLQAIRWLQRGHVSVGRWHCLLGIEIAIVAEGIAAAAGITAIVPIDSLLRLFAGHSRCLPSLFSSIWCWLQWDAFQSYDLLLGWLDRRSNYRRVHWTMDFQHAHLDCWRMALMPHLSYVCHECFNFCCYTGLAWQSHFAHYCWLINWWWAFRPSSSSTHSSMATC
jgi:hypothetical protein